MPFNTLLLEYAMVDIKFRITIKILIPGVLYFGEDIIYFTCKDTGTHLIRSGFSMALFLYQLHTKKIMIIGRWYRNTFIRYIQRQVKELSKVIIALVV